MAYNESRLKEELKQLKACIPYLEKCLKAKRDGVSLDGSEKSKLHSIKKLLQSVEGHPSGTLTWACVKMLLMRFNNETIADITTRQKILFIFAQQLNVLDKAKNFSEMKILWSMLHLSKYYMEFVQFGSISHRTLLYMDIVQKCFHYLRDDAFRDFASDVLLQSGVACLVNLANDANSLAAVEVLDFFFMQLLEPLCTSSKEIAKSLLNTCGWRLANVIREMLNDVLLEPSYDGPLTSPTKVYDVIYELVLINKNLVVGLINNTALCLSQGRRDRSEGLHFFCKLFALRTIPGTLDVVGFFSRLWDEFLTQEDSLHSPKELLILSEHTPNLLNNSGSFHAWSSLLLHLLKYEIEPECEEALISGVTEALRRNPALLNDDDKGPNSIFLIMKNLLTPASQYELDFQNGTRLCKDLGDIYKQIATVWMQNMINNSSFHLAAMRILDCLLGTCELLDCSNERWTRLRKIFVTKLVPFEYDAARRMKMLLYLWIHSPEKWDILHELFYFSRRARVNLRLAFKLVTDKKFTREMRNKNMPLLMLRIDELLVHYDVCQEFLAKKFMPAVGASPQLASLLIALASEMKSCKENCKIMKQIKDNVPTEGWKEKEILDGLLYFTTEFTCDQKSMKCLVELVDSCVTGSDVSQSLGRHLLHVARSSIQLLNEMIFLCPRLVLHDFVLDYIYKWARLFDENISMLSLRCLCNASVIPYKLEKYYPALIVTKMLPMWIHLIQSESREQAKMAIRCLSAHSTSSRDETFRQVFYIISSHLEDQSDQENFERGVAAIGYFSTLCPLEFKRSVRDVCLSLLLLQVVKGSSIEEHSQTSSSDALCNNTWIDWKECSYHIVIKVQALRSIGRCMRFCGDSVSIEYTLEILAEILATSGEEMAHTKVDSDILRCEVAAAILNIFEVSVKMSLPLILSLSQMMIDSRLEVRLEFSKKLCRGLTPHKFISSSIGRSRGHLPQCMLGLLALFGTDVWIRDEKSRHIAEGLCKEVFMSQRNAVTLQARHKALTIQDFYAQNPHLVLENILAAALPILVKHIIEVTEIISEENETETVVTDDSIIEAAQCLQFLCAMLYHPDAYGSCMRGRVSREYLTQMAQTAKKTLVPITCPVEFKKYAAAIEVLEIVIMHNITKVKSVLTPPMKLPEPFYSSDSLEQLYVFESQLSMAVQKKMKNLIFRKSTIIKNVPGLAANEGEGDFEGEEHESINEDDQSQSNEDDQSQSNEDDQSQSNDDEPSMVSDMQLSRSDSYQSLRRPHESNDEFVDTTFSFGAPNARSTPASASSLQGHLHKRRKF